MFLNKDPFRQRFLLWEYAQTCNSTYRGLNRLTCRTYRKLWDSLSVSFRMWMDDHAFTLQQEAGEVSLMLLTSPDLHANAKQVPPSVISCCMLIIWSYIWIPPNVKTGRNKINTISMSHRKKTLKTHYLYIDKKQYKPWKMKS